MNDVGLGANPVFYISKALAQMLSAVAAAKPTLHVKRMPLPHALHKVEALRCACLRVCLFACLLVSLFFIDCIPAQNVSATNVLALVNCSYLHLRWFPLAMHISPYFNGRTALLFSLGLG